MIKRNHQIANVGDLKKALSNYLDDDFIVIEVDDVAYDDLYEIDLYHVDMAPFYSKGGTSKKEVRLTLAPWSHKIK